MTSPIQMNNQSPETQIKSIYGVTIEFVSMDLPDTQAPAESSSSATACAAIPADDPLSDPYASLNSHCLELSTLQELACRGAWRTIIDKVARARSLSLLSKPHEYVIYLVFNLLALVKLRRFPEAQDELQTVEHDLDSEQYLFETYPDQYPNHRPGSMVPFALRWLHAHLPFTLGNRQLTLDRLYSLLHFIRVKKLKSCDSNCETSSGLWTNRERFVVNTIISHHLSQKEFRLCLDLLKADINENKDPLLISKLGYIQLQYGDLEAGKRSFDLVEEMVAESEDLGLINLVGRNKALMFLVEKDCASAVREYESCIERDESDMVAVNNKAICLMYLRDLSDSIKLLESALERIPTIALNETLVVNLCSMYELAYVNHGDVKKTLGNWIARVAPDDFDTSCTRI